MPWHILSITADELGFVQKAVHRKEGFLIYFYKNSSTSKLGHSQAKEQLQSLCQSSSNTHSNTASEVMASHQRAALGHSNIFLTLHNRHKSPACTQLAETSYEDHGCCGPIRNCPAPSEQLQPSQDPQSQQQMLCKGCVRMAAKSTHRALPGPGSVCVQLSGQAAATIPKTAHKQDPCAAQLPQTEGAS